MRFTISGMVLGFLVVALGGCGNQESTMVGSAGTNDSQHESAVAGITSSSGDTAVMKTDVAPNAVTLQRKIIYNTNVGLVVDDYRKFEGDLQALVNANGGFVANNKTNRRYNDSQSGDWVIRIPVAQYASFLSGVEAIGFAESRNETAQDVTEEYVDIEARIKNKKALESRVLGILEKRSGKLSEILEIERELSRVREEIERMEGRLRYLRERTSLATITIHCREQQEYLPPASPTLASRLWLALSGSIGTMGDFVANLLVVLFAILPWLIVLALATWVFSQVTGQRVRDLIAKRLEMLR